MSSYRESEIASNMPAPAPAASDTHDYERHGAPFGSINVVTVGTLKLADEALHTWVDINMLGTDQPFVRDVSSLLSNKCSGFASTCQQTQIEYSPPILMLRQAARHDKMTRYMLVDELVDELNAMQQVKRFTFDEI